MTLNVSASKVDCVITSVLKLANKKTNKVPSKSSVLNMNLQRLCLAHRTMMMTVAMMVLFTPNLMSGTGTPSVNHLDLTLKMMEWTQINLSQIS